MSSCRMAYVSNYFADIATSDWALEIFRSSMRRPARATRVQMGIDFMDVEPDS